jgi:xanthine dehydrogenase accessory factor
MKPLSPILAAAFATGEPVAIVTIIETHGSTPRETGATMLVQPQACFGSIGGGQLEFHATGMAREMLASGGTCLTLPLTLGPHMGQCCGGRIVLELRRAVPADVEVLAALDKAAQDARPVVLIFGAGHTARALAAQLALMPVKAVIVDDRSDELAQVPSGTETRHLPDPETAIHAAAAGTAFVVMTHSHALDYRLAEAALRRGDAAHVGLIGSATKRARFLASAQRNGPLDLARFSCPLGGTVLSDKRPEIIAALTVAELARVLFGTPGIASRKIAAG